MSNYDKSLDIYCNINDLIKNGTVVPYEGEILQYLGEYTDGSKPNIKDSNYLTALTSNYSMGRTFYFSRYLALAMNGKDFHICEGNLETLFNGDFPHSWIESGDFVYDVAFIGKWPKDVYYSLFRPTVEREFDQSNIEEDEIYIDLRKSNIESKNPARNIELKYHDWYNYYQSAVDALDSGLPTHSMWVNFDKVKEEVQTK